jgi:hypothetical protein
MDMTSLGLWVGNEEMFGQIAIKSIDVRKSGTATKNGPIFPRLLQWTDC